MKEINKQSHRSLYDQTSDFIYPLLKDLVNSKIEISTKGTESIIPTNEPLSIIVIPHSGWAEAAGVILGIENVRKNERLLIFTKYGNRFLRLFLGDEHMAYIDRENPGPKDMRVLYEKLSKDNSIIISAAEGTRKGNPDDENDIYTLAELHPGPVWFAIKFKSKIIVTTVLGADTISPNIDDTVRSGEYMKALNEFGHILKGSHKLHVRFRHLLRTPEEMEIDSKLRGDEQKERIKILNEEVARIAVKDILSINPDFPLGPHDYLRP